MSGIPAGFDFDPFDERYFENPYPYYKLMRDQAPAYRHATREGRVWPHFWMISRAKDVNDALADWRTFSSARGTLIDTDISLIPPNMFNMDPPRHDELRAILARVLTPARVARLESHIRASARAILPELSWWSARGSSQAKTTPTVTAAIATCTRSMPRPMSGGDGGGAKSLTG